MAHQSDPGTPNHELEDKVTYKKQSSRPSNPVDEVNFYARQCSTIDSRKSQSDASSRNGEKGDVKADDVTKTSQDEFFVIPIDHKNMSQALKN